MFNRYRTQGFVIKKENFREADQIFTIFTEDFGKLKILGRGIRKIQSKLRGGVKLFCGSEIEFIQGKSYKTLTDTALINNFRNIEKTLEKLLVSYKISGILDELVKGEERDEKIWNLLWEVLSRLDNLSSGDEWERLKVVYYYFLWNLLSILGYRPQLGRCVFCQKKNPGEIYFSPKEGGMVCGRCFRKAEEAKRITPNVTEILKIISNKDWNTLFRLKMTSPSLDALAVFSDNYLKVIKDNLGIGRSTCGYSSLP